MFKASLRRSLGLALQSVLTIPYVPLLARDPVLCRGGLWLTGHRIELRDPGIERPALGLARLLRVLLPDD